MIESAAVLSFLGGSAFRMIWGEVSGFLTRAQTHKQEQVAREQEDRLAAAAHARNLEAIKLQHSLGVDVIHVKTEADLQLRDAAAWNDAAAKATALTGIAWVDAWNNSVRPFWASVAALLWVSSRVAAGFELTEFDQSLIGLTIGFYFADRQYAKRGR